MKSAIDQIYPKGKLVKENKKIYIFNENIFRIHLTNCKKRF